MSGWAWLWYIVIVTAIVTYFGLAVVISIGGFFDVKKMFRRLNAAHAAENNTGAVAHTEVEQKNQ